MHYNVGDVIVDTTDSHLVVLAKILHKYSNRSETWYELKVYKLAHNKYDISTSNVLHYPEDCLEGYEVVKNKRELVIALL